MHKAQLAAPFQLIVENIIVLILNINVSNLIHQFQIE